MDDELLTARNRDLAARLRRFVEEECIPGEEEWMRELECRPSDKRFGWIPQTLRRLQERARELGLWNLFLPAEAPEGPGLTNVEYAPLAEMMGLSPLAAEACNCNAPDTGNMEVLLRFGTEEQKRRWLRPLLDGRIRSAFLMTEPAVASSDPRNLVTSIREEGDSLVITGRKWWSTGALRPNCELAIVVGCSDPTAPPRRRHSIVLVPMRAPGVRIVRALTVFGYDHAPDGHAEVELDHVRVPRSNVVLGVGRGLDVAQGRLGPGRLHHCMRAVGLGERCLRMLLERAAVREAFGKRLLEHGTVLRDVAESRIALDASRLLVWHAARVLDARGSADRRTRQLLSVVKAAVPRAVLAVVDRAIQVHGGAGVSQDTILAAAWAGLRTLRLADGPDEVHLLTVGGLEIRMAMDELKAKL